MTTKSKKVINGARDLVSQELKEEGRRRKEEGRRKKEEGRRRKEDGKQRGNQWM